MVQMSGSQPGSGRNVIILTSGLAGSSVLAGLLAKGGYWAGERTHKKEYDTNETTELIELNRRIFRESGYTGDYIREFSTDAIARLSAAAHQVDLAPYRDFVARCNEHRPWVWKDPRLWLTIYFWKSMVKFDECRIVLLTRDPVQAWVSGTLRRHIRSYGPFRRYETSIRDSIESFLKGNGLPYIHITYEGLIARPEKTLESLNLFVGSNLQITHLQEAYRGPISRYPRATAINHVKAALIYLKNYSERY